MRVLITGFAGFIGSSLTERLLGRGYDVLGNDDLSHNAVDPRELLGATQTLCCSVEQLPLFARLLEGVEMIVHCASPVGHARLTPEAQIAWSIIRDTQVMLELAERVEARLVLLSSSEVLAFRGETDIRAQYALGKLTSEAMVLGHPKVDARIVRPYNVTGKRQRADGGFVMARFRDAALAGEPLTIFGSGEQQRCFLHVSDFVDFLVRLIEKWPERKLWCVFNPKNGISIATLADRFVGYRVENVHSNVNGAHELGNPHWRDSSERPLEMSDYLACRELDWEPRMTLEAIVAEHLSLKEASV